VTGYFITGTGTGVGKTFVGCALARRATELGRKVFAFKPMETGCGDRGDDQEALAIAAGDWQRDELRGIYRHPLPAAPFVAARAVGETIDLDRILATAHAGAALGSLTIVEGAGGWRVPITATTDMSDLARRLELPVIIVAHATLGTINHTLLTIEAVERDRCRIAAVILSSRPDDDAAFAASNREEISRRWSGAITILDDDPRVLDALL